MLFLGFPPFFDRPRSALICWSSGGYPDRPGKDGHERHFYYTSPRVETGADTGFQKGGFRVTLSTKKWRIRANEWNVLSSL